MPPYGGVYPYGMPNYYPSIYAGVPAPQYQPPPVMGQDPGSIPGYGTSLPAAFPQPNMVALIPSLRHKAFTITSQAPIPPQASPYFPPTSQQQPPSVPQWPPALHLPDAGPTAPTAMVMSSIPTYSVSSGRELMMPLSRARTLCCLVGVVSRWMIYWRSLAERCRVLVRVV